MARTKEYTVRKTVQPAAVGSDETITIYSLKKGQRVVAASARVDIAAAASSAVTFALGVTGTIAGFIAAFDPETATIVDGQGSLLANAGGYLAVADIDVIVTYDQTTPGATNPKATFTMTIRDERY